MRTSSQDSSGFALPTTMIAGVVMLMVLLSGLTSASSVNTALRSQYNDKLIQAAADSGVAMAKACLEKSGGTVTWSNAAPLGPGTDCSGAVRSECPAADTCWLIKQPTLRTSFTVKEPTALGSGSFEIPSLGLIDQLRSSGGTVAQTRATEHKSRLSSGTPVSRIAPGYGYTYALTSDGKIFQWASSLVAVATTVTDPLASKTVTQIAKRAGGSVALTSDGQVFSEALGYGSAPVVMAGALVGKTVTQIATSFNGNIYALTSDGKVFASGSNGYGQLGNGTTTDSSVPVAVTMTGALAGKTVTQIAGGSNTAYALTSDGKVFSWGQNYFGTLGNGDSFNNSSVPVAVTMTGAMAGKTVTQIATVHSGAYALTSDNKIFSWGLNSSGNLGNGTATASSVPVAVTMTGAMAGKTVTQIGGNNSFNPYALSSDGKIFAWGPNEYGQLGNGTTTDSSVPVAVTMTGALAGKTVTQIGGGSYTAYALTSDGGVFEWGSGYPANKTVPVAVEFSKSYRVLNH